MDGDNGQKKKFDRNIELEYNHDRLIGMKMIQAYQLLVLDKIWVKNISIYLVGSHCSLKKEMGLPPILVMIKR